MSGLQSVWKMVSGKVPSPRAQVEVRMELLMLMLGCCTFHTFLGADVSNVCTASDASGSGGAVGKAVELTSAGQDFCRSVLHVEDVPIKVPVLVVSLFNGIGGAFRAYDLVGTEPTGLIAYDISKPACCVTSRRWPHAFIGGDVTKITYKTVREWFLKYPPTLSSLIYGQGSPVLT